MSTSNDLYTQFGQVEPEPEEPGDVEPEPAPEPGQAEDSKMIHRKCFLVGSTKPIFF